MVLLQMNWHRMKSLFSKQAGFTLLELVYVISIICVLLAILVPQLLVQKSRIVEIQAQRRLRNIGSVMADYTLSHHDGNYADFQELQDANLISKDCSLSSIIVDYSLAFINSEPVASESSGGYTIIAYPIPDRSRGRLSTFAITEDNVIRVYNPGPGISPNDPHTWDPVL
jgi:prepilin-type N-terminal cleavage/methylation domain-containing protein